jgi:hypothetical protein
MIDQTDDTADLAADAAEASLRGTALVPTGPTPQHAQTGGRLSRPDAGFVAHLIATAEQAPQTRRLRRASPDEALSAYAAHLTPAPRAGRQTRQVI